MKLKEHPLWPAIEEWIRNTSGPEVEFAEPEGFKRNVHLAALANPLHGHPQWKADAMQRYWDTALLGQFLLGHTCDAKSHFWLYQASSHRVGNKLRDAAHVAYQFLDICSDFGPSTRRDGFVVALEAWSSLISQTDFDAEKELSWVYRNLVGKEEQAADFWLKACQDVIGDTAKYTEILGLETGKAAAAERMKKLRSKTAKSSKYKNWILCLWIPAAFWSKTDAEIVSILDPDRKENMLDAYGRVRRDISELRLSASRRISS